MAGKRASTMTYHVYKGDGYTISTIPLKDRGKLIAECTTYKEANELVERLMEEDDGPDTGETDCESTSPTGIS